MDNGASSYRRFLDGDESAFNEIMEELFRSLVFFINGYVHDIHAAEDIAIDAFSDLVVPQKSRVKAEKTKIFFQKASSGFGDVSFKERSGRFKA